MKNIIAIALKELKSYFISPIAYVIATVFLIISGYYFYSAISAFSLHCFKMMNYTKAVETLNINTSVFYGIFQTMTNTIMFMMPIITMRIFAEERKNKTMELLMTSPITILEIVLGKFMAAFVIFALMVLFTIYMPVYASIYSNIDWGAIMTGYIGLLLIGSVFLAIGIFASSLTENQIVAALISFTIILMFVIIQWLARMAEGQLAIVLNYLSLANHMPNFFRGIIDTKNVVYYLSFTAFGLFMTFRVIESKRWAQ
jgi:ABC-2 type transport system permease protein